MPVSLIAKTELRYAGKVLKPGDAFTADSERDAATLKILGRAINPPDDSPEDVTESDDATPTKRKYRRRDLTAEGS